MRLSTVIIVAAVLGLVEGTLAATINVGSGDSIQAAIDSAAPGDEIMVAPGTYYEAIDFVGKAITLRSSAGPEFTVIDASGLETSVVSCQNSEGPDTVLDGFTVTGGEGTVFLVDRVGGGMYNYLTSPTVRNCIFTQNTAASGGGMYNRYNAPAITDCVFIGNTTAATGSGGAGIMSWGSDSTITNCVFAENASLSYGGGIACLVLSELSLVNCEFYGNTSFYGGGIYVNASDLTLVNCTFTENDAFFGGALNCFNFAETTVFNSIFWNNTVDEINSYSPSEVTTLSYCNIRGGWDGPGSNNSDAEPMFVDPANGDYRLSVGSPCIDVGDNTAVPEGVDTDLDGNPRMVGIVDLGPFESQDEVVDTCPWDTDGSSTVEVTDLLDLLGWWNSDPAGPPDFDGSGNVDVTDLLALLANWGSCP